MAQTLIQKILSRNTGNTIENTGDLIRIQPELILTSNLSINRIIQKFHQSGMKTIVNPDKLVIVNNASPVDSTHQTRDTQQFQDFVHHHKIKHYYELGRSGFPSNVVINNGHIVPGMLIVSSEQNFSELGVLGCLPVLASEHEMALSMATGELWMQVPVSARIRLNGEPGQWITGTDIGLYIIKNYDLPDNPNCVLEFSGEGLAGLPLNERYNLARILTYYGYEYVLFESDSDVLAYLNQRTTGEAHFEIPDDKADYVAEFEINMSAVTPMLAVSVEGEEVEISGVESFMGKTVHKVIAGASGAGRYEDFLRALKMIRYSKVHDNVQMIIMPSDAMVFSDLINDGLAGIFLDLGCEIYPSSVFKVLKDGLGVYTKAVNVMTTSPSLFQSACQTEGHHVYLGSIISCFAAAVQGTIIHPKALEEKIIRDQENSHHHHDSHNETQDE